MTELGWPVVTVYDDSSVIELALPTLTTSAPVQALASLAILLTEGPEVVAWPPHVKRAWFANGEESASARRAHDWLRRSAIVEMTPAQAPPTFRQPPSTEFPVGVRRSKPLDSS